MATARIRTASSSPWFTLLLITAGLLVVTAAALAIYLGAGGEVRIPFTSPPQTLSLNHKEEAQPWSPPAGKVPVPMSARKIEAYTMVSRDDMFNPKSGEFTLRYVDPAIASTRITDITKIVGRVLKRSKDPGFFFSETDFLPVGTRPGLVAGIPTGKRGYRIELSRVRGFYGLLPGDRFDLLATVTPTGDPTSELRKLGGVEADRLALEASLANVGNQSTVRVLVQNGVVASAMETVQVPLSGSTATGARGAHTRPVQEVVIAILPEEAARVAQAIATDAVLTVVPRSGRPDDPQDSLTPELVPQNPYATGDGPGGHLRLVETIGGGGQRGVVPVPSRGDDPQKDTPRAK